MNILYIEHYAGSADMGMEFRPYYLAREWVKLGHQVTILAGDYSHLRKKNPTVERDFQSEQIDGIEYVWLRTGAYRGNDVKRALSMERFVRKLLSHAGQIARKWRPDVVIASSTYPLDTYAAHRIAKLAGAKYVHEVHDMWPATLYEVGGMSRKHPFVVAMQIAEDYAYRHCDKCVSLLSHAREYMVEHGLAPEKFINVQNGVVEEEWSDPESIPADHARFFSENAGKFVVGYFGSHSLSNALDNILDTAREFLHRDDGVIFVLVGDGVEKPRLVERAGQEQLTNVFFLPPVRKKAVPDLVRHFDCVYITGQPSPLYRFGICLNKLYDSMMAGLPIICAFDAPETLVRTYQCGIQCDPARREDVVQAIEQLRRMTPDERSRIGENGRRAIEERFTYGHLAQEFLKQIST